MSQLSSVTSEVLAFLQGQTYSQTVAFSESIIPRRKVQEMGSTINGDVFPFENTRERQNRSGVTSVYTVHIAVNKKVTPDNDSEVQGLMDLVEEIATSIEDTKTTSGRVSNVTINPVFDFDRLRENNVFTSMIAVELRGIS